MLTQRMLTHKKVPEIFFCFNPVCSNLAAIGAPEYPR